MTEMSEDIIILEKKIIELKVDGVYEMEGHIFRSTWNLPTNWKRKAEQTSSQESWWLSVTL